MMNKIAAIADLLKYTNGSDYVSFDLFDTLIRRRLLKVNEVHDTVSAYALAQVGKRRSGNPFDLTLLRYRMSDELKSTVSGGLQEPAIDMVWDRIFRRDLPDSTERANVVSRIVSFEHQIELANLGLVDGTLELLAALRANGKTLVAISDMYFRIDVMRDILDRLGLFDLFDHLYVSENVGLTKQTGDLFRHVLDDLGIEASRVVHVGDNPISDVARPIELGISAVHVEQPQLLELERPEYGNRKRIEEEVADLVKTHLFGLILDAHDRRVEHIYFMARDGCAIHDFLGNWMNPLFEGVLAPPDYSNLYVNRILSCWGGVDFSVNWLVQSIGLAFWLNHGQATPEELCALLGIEEIPDALGTRLLNAERDTERVAKIFREAGLAAKIKASIIAKRLQLIQYLRDIGFFDKKAVAFSDVGYSGTVVRDLNSLLLSRRAEDDEVHPPSMVLHLIATNDNFASNQTRAFPFVEFSPHVVLPSEALPEELKATFAWLEFFFKHPTLQPILRFVESDGQLMPELRSGKEAPRPMPTDRVLQHAIARDEDIVLLWMAAADLKGQLIEPIIRRFAAPDMSTIEQMEDEVFEKHSVLGDRRSIVLRVPGARVEAITVAAREGDYWIPGSVVASEAIKPEASPSKHFRRTNRRRFFNWLWRKRSDGFVPKIISRQGFDPSFYGSFYADLHHFRSDDELWRHYRVHGRGENRLASRAALLLQLEAECGAVPADFDARGYLRSNPDLAVHIGTADQALDHYMRNGRHEGRTYLKFSSELTEAFERMRAEGRITLSRSEDMKWKKGQSTFALFLERHAVRAGPWLHDLDPAEFRALHHQWCGPVDSLAGCIVVLLEKGLAACPSLSLRAPFDPDFYRLHSQSFAKLPDQELYLRYLNCRSADDLAPSEQAALIRLWGHAEFPQSFDWRRFRATLPERHSDAARSRVFKLFIDAPGVERLKFVDGEDASLLIEFLAIRAWRHHGRHKEASILLREALEAGGTPGRIHHWLGDLALQSGNASSALVHFRNGLNSASVDNWSSINAANLLLDQGDYRSALDVLEASAVTWQERAPWRRMLARAIQMQCAAILRGLAAPSRCQASLKEADALVNDMAARLPSPVNFTAESAGALVLTSRQHRESTRDRAGAAGIAVLGIDEIVRGDAIGTMLAHELVIFHEVPFGHDFVVAAGMARSLGKKTVAWLGDLVDWEEHSLSRCEWDDADRTRSRLNVTNMASYALSARYCDSVVTTLAGCEGALREIAPGASIEITGILRGNTRGSDRRRRIVLVEPAVKARPQELDAIASAICISAKADERFLFLIDETFAERQELRSIAGRWEPFRSNESLPVLAALMNTADAIVQLNDEAKPGYSFSAEATARGVPAIVAAATPPSALSLRILQGVDGQSAGRAPSVAPQRTNRSSKTEVVPRRKRILFANVFFAPQVIGGATRVLKDNIDYLLDHHGDEFEIAVFTADEQNERAYESRLDGYRGIPVFRLATPQKLHMDWRGWDPIVGAQFENVLKAFEPEFVHIHCLQRLSVSVAEACRDNDVHYVVTLHDGWWVSDYAFLSDETGLPALPSQDFYDQKHLAGVPVADSVLRAERLRTSLLGAQKRLSVSESFAAIYNDCGISCDVIENGVSRIQPVARSETTGRIQLCHIGGLQHHKGAYLVEAALRHNAYANLHFTVVDLARGPGEESHTIWGTTPVTITGKMSTAQLAAFYARMNVLIAPSTWPESYGLVTREALGHGLWVIAGDRGAMADPVREGVNGFIVQVADASGVAQALRAIDGDPDRYRQLPAGCEPLRTADDQSRELIDLYRSLRRNGSSEEGAGRRRTA